VEVDNRCDRATLNEMKKSPPTMKTIPGRKNLVRQADRDKQQPNESQGWHRLRLLVMTLMCLMLFVASMLASFDLSSQKARADDDVRTENNDDEAYWGPNQDIGIDSNSGALGSPGTNGQTSLMPNVQLLPELGLLPPLADTDESHCPIPIHEYGTEAKFEQDEHFLSWSVVSERPLASLAEEILSFLRLDSWTLEEYGYIDLFSEAWSCLASRQIGRPQSDETGGDVLIITILPSNKHEIVGGVNLNTVRVVYMSSRSLEE